MGWLRSWSLGPFHTSRIAILPPLAASRPLAPFGKAVHTDKDASAVGDDAGHNARMLQHCLSEQTLCRRDCGPLSAKRRTAWLW